MTLVLGIDPGSSGAFAVYDTESRALVGPVYDMPIWFQTFGKRKRKRIDAMAIADLLDEFEVMGVDLIVMEAVGGRSGESGSGSFAFGYGVGILYMACFYSGIPIETVSPQLWKQQLNVPGKSKADDSAIVARANELLPNDRQHFKGPRGGIKIDRAEAAMIAKFGGDIILNNLNPKNDVELRIAYANADTGA